MLKEKVSRSNTSSLEKKFLLKIVLQIGVFNSMCMEIRQLWWEFARNAKIGITMWNTALIIIDDIGINSEETKKKISVI